MGRHKKDESIVATSDATVSTTTDSVVTPPQAPDHVEVAPITPPVVEDKSKETKKDGLEEVTLLKLIVVDDVAYPAGTKMKVTKEGKAGLISIGALK